jgi:hypothetical protein
VTIFSLRGAFTNAEINALRRARLLNVFIP